MLVSLNQPIGVAISEQKELEKQGYMVTGQYQDEFDVGLIYEKPDEVNKDAVLKKHLEHMSFINIFRSV